MTGKEFSKMVTGVQGKLFRFAFHFLQDVQEAEDAVQEAFSKVWQRKEQLKQVLNPEAFFMTIVKNISLDRIREKKRTPMIVLKPEDLVGEPKDEILEDQINALRLAIRSLPDSFRSVIHLRDVEGLKYAEIEKILELSPSDVKIRIHRGRKILREKLIGQS
jgi:RNA polymerase sigma-70 factor, ECF subfamily